MSATARMISGAAMLAVDRALAIVKNESGSMTPNTTITSPSIISRP